MTRRSLRRGSGRLIAGVAALSLIAAACGGSDDSGSSSGGTTASTEQPSTDAGTPGTDGGTSASTPATGPADTTGGTSTAGECDTSATLTWGYGDQIRDWDPHSSPAGQDQWYLMTVYDRLFGQSPTGETLPQLVEKWEFSDDGLTLTLHMRDGVLFQDGTPLTTDIVVQNLDRARGAMDAPKGEEGFSTSFKADLAAISGVKAVDDSTVEIDLSEPNVALPNILSDRPGMIMLPSTFDGSGETTPIGTGPFKLDSWTSGEGGEADLTKFADYWDADSIKLAGLVLKDIRDPSARINALQSGDIDGARIDPVDYDAATSDPNLTVDTGDTVEVIWLNMDIETTPELEKTETRVAMSKAIDRQSLVDNLAFGLGTPTETMLPPFYWAGDPDLKPTPDVDAAKQMLADAGVGSFSMPLLATSTQGLTASVGQAVAGMMSDIGITMNFEVAGENLASRLYFDRDGGGVVGPWSGRPDPSQTIANVDTPAGFVNIAKKSIPEINTLLAQANAATDRDARADIFRQIDQLEAENFPTGIALFSPKTIFAYDNNVSGLPIYVQGKHEFRDACVAKS